MKILALILLITSASIHGSPTTATRLVNAGNLTDAIQEINKIPKTQWQQKKELLINVINRWDPASQPELGKLIREAARTGLTAGHAQEIYPLIDNKSPNIPTAPPSPLPVAPSGAGRLPTETELAKEIAARNERQLQTQITQLQQQIQDLQNALAKEKSTRIDAENKIIVAQKELDKEKAAQIKAEQQGKSIQDTLAKEKENAKKLTDTIEALNNETKRLKDQLIKVPELTPSGITVVTVQPTKPELAPSSPAVIAIQGTKPTLAPSGTSVGTIPPTKPRTLHRPVRSQ